MTRSKKIFVAAALAFFLMLMYLAYDISRRTTFPGSQPGSEEATPDWSADSLSSSDSTLSTP